MKHTPGIKAPSIRWSWWKNCCRKGGMVTEDKFGVHICAPTYFEKNPEITEANARLIAASPEMLERLINNFKVMFKIWSCTCVEGIDYGMLENEISETQEIIEKATGLSIEEVLK